MKKIIYWPIGLFVFLSCLARVSAAQPTVGVEASKAGAIAQSTFANIPWQSVQLPFQQQIEPSLAGSILGDSVKGKFAAFAIPADRGDLTINFESDVHDSKVYVPNVLVLDGQKIAERFYPAHLWHYQPAKFLSPDRVVGQFRLVPRPGQKFLYVLFYTAPHDLSQTMQMIAPAKAFAKGTNHAVPDIPDPIAHHVPNGVMKLSISSQLNEQIGAVHVGQMMATTPSMGTALPETADYFKRAIKKAVEQRDIGKAMQLEREAQRVGITQAKSFFIQAIKEKIPAK